MIDYNELFNNLTDLRGKYKLNAPLGKLTWFNVGGSADALFDPKDEADLQYFLRNCPNEIPITIIGLGSNLLIRDGGVRGIVIRLRGKFSYISHFGNIISAGAGTSDLRIARYAAKQQLKGFSFLAGIPGNLGGALRMNAGAFGSEMQDIFTSARAIDRHGWIHEILFENMGFSYRHTEIPADWIFLSASMQASGHHSTEVLMDEIREIQRIREDSQPKAVLTGGSTFANPEGYRAWELIDKAGLRGFKLGGAQVSEKHCNFLINTGHATAKDIEDLGEHIRAEVKKQSGIELHWEIQRIGKYN